VSWVVTAARLAYELGNELWREHQRAKAKERAAQQWANTPASVRACVRCGELAYQPGQVRCFRCGGSEFKS
jgi:uncharacterized paraquat-inducible protein A